MSEELKIATPHTKEVDGELIPDFEGSPRTYPTFATDRGTDLARQEYMEVGRRMKKQVKKWNEAIKEAYMKNLMHDEVKREIDRINKLLTPTQRDFLFVIRLIQWEDRFSPTSWELAQVMGCSTRNSRYHVEALVKKGFLEWSPHPQERSYMKRILYPRGMWWPWHDYTQFPPIIFWNKNEDKYGSIAKMKPQP